jgi:hypothetical protein
MVFKPRLLHKASVFVEGNFVDVFKRYSSLEELSSFLSDITSLKVLTEQATGLGSRFIHARSLLGFPVSREVTVTAWDPPHNFTASFVVLTLNIDSIHEVEQHPQGCIIHLSLLAEPKGLRWLFALPVWLLLSGEIKRGLQRELDDLANDFQPGSSISYEPEREVLEISC